MSRRSLQRRGRGGGKNREKSSEVPPSPMSPTPRGRLGATGYKGSGAPEGTSAAPEPEAMWRVGRPVPSAQGRRSPREGGKVGATPKVTSGRPAESDLI